MHLSKTILTSAMPFLVIAFLCSATLQDDIARIAAEMESSDIGLIWDRVADLEAMGPDAAPRIRDSIASVGEKAQLGFAKALIQLREREAGLKTIRKLLTGAQDSRVQQFAAQIFASTAPDEDLRSLKRELPTIDNPYVKIAVLKGLGGQRIPDRGAMRQLKAFLGSEDFSIRCEAALALAELDDVESGRAVLEDIRYEPTLRGRLADRHLRNDDLFRELMEGSLGNTAEEQIKRLELENEELTRRLFRIQAQGSSFPVLQEIIDLVQAHHIDEAITVEDLLDAAAHGMLASPPRGVLDRFTGYLNVEETSKFYEGLEGLYAGIGAVVAVDPDTRFLRVEKPIYSGPAYRLGIRRGDTILKVGTRSTFGEDVSDMVKLIRGEPGTKVTLTIARRGWLEPQEFTVTREEVELPELYHELLPGKIGYVRLLQFGMRAHQDLREAVEKMEDQGMEALILDLRENQGGLLSQAVEVAGMFLDKPAVVVTSEGRDEEMAPKRAYSPLARRGQGGPGSRPDYPLVLLVNHGSASASEIVAGALQDYGRAVLVGEKTYGKGSVQRPLRLKSTVTKDPKTGEELFAVLKLTVAEYKLPKGRSIHDKGDGKGGIRPDIGIKPRMGPVFDERELARLYEKKVFEDYMEKHYDSNRDRFRSLAEFDGGDTSRYPGFEEWYESLETDISRELLRFVLRTHYVRNRAEDERGAEFPHDLQEDIQLQRAIAECLRDRGGARSVEAYAFFPEEWPEFDVAKEYPERSAK
jgi:carboxyl-terminal processing protease